MPEQLISWGDQPYLYCFPLFPMLMPCVSGTIIGTITVGSVCPAYSTHSIHKTYRAGKKQKDRYHDISANQIFLFLLVTLPLPSFIATSLYINHVTWLINAPNLLEPVHPTLYTLLYTYTVFCTPTPCQLSLAIVQLIYTPAL